MRSGRLRERITIEVRNETLTESGVPNGGWVTFASRRAAVREVSGKETYEADQSVARQTHEVRVRYLPDVTRDMRVVWRNRILHIVAFTVDEKLREIVMGCEERAA
jgi:SPP1 family predicted phage head-tail adaptor